uniref:G-protein coupled receptors family 1 profile domain-containing protein n=1 Tax=Romanomermis culicivorax TaxID=13658 RepID=A0A915IK62_ROMCU
MTLFENGTYCEFNFTQILLDENEEELLFSKFNYVIVGPLLVVVICLGLVGNTLSAIVFLTSTSRPRIYYYLITLAVWDAILLLCSLFLYGLPVLFIGKFYPLGSWVAIYPMIYMLSNAAHSGNLSQCVVWATLWFSH